MCTEKPFNDCHHQSLDVDADGVGRESKYNGE